MWESQKKREGKERENIWWNNGWKLLRFDERHEINIQESQWTPNKMNSKKPTLRHNIIKLSKDKNKKSILKTAREKWFIIYKGSSVRLLKISHQKQALEARGSAIQNAKRKKNYNLPLERTVDDTSIWIYANTLNFNLGFVYAPCAAAKWAPGGAGLCQRRPEFVQHLPSRTLALCWVVESLEQASRVWLSAEGKQLSTVRQTWVQSVTHPVELAVWPWLCCLSFLCPAHGLLGLHASYMHSVFHYAWHMATVSRC